MVTTALGLAQTMAAGCLPATSAATSWRQTSPARTFRPDQVGSYWATRAVWVIFANPTPGMCLVAVIR